jgi:hypothetical protein
MSFRSLADQQSFSFRRPEEALKRALNTPKPEKGMRPKTGGKSKPKDE